MKEEGLYSSRKCFHSFYCHVTSEDLFCTHRGSNRVVKPRKSTRPFPLSLEILRVEICEVVLFGKLRSIKEDFVKCKYIIDLTLS
jgi:hypothetical protein